MRSPDNQLSRREFLKAAGLAAGASFLAACGGDDIINTLQPPELPFTPSGTPIPTEPLPPPTASPTPTKTEKPPTPTKTATPRATSTERPTPTENPVAFAEKWGNNWVEKFFIPWKKFQELRDTGATIITDLPPEKWEDLKITGPGQAYVACSGKAMKKVIDKKILTRLWIDRVHYGTNICAYKAATEQEIREYIKIRDPSANREKIQQRVDGYIRASQAMEQLIPEDYYYLDPYFTLFLIANPNHLDTWTWRLFSVSNEDSSVSTYIRDLPLPIQ